MSFYDNDILVGVLECGDKDLLSKVLA